jgi:hypothetical protein
MPLVDVALTVADDVVLIVAGHLRASRPSVNRNPALPCRPAQPADHIPHDGAEGSDSVGGKGDGNGVGSGLGASNDSALAMSSRA